MNRKPELARMESTKQLGMGKATHWEVLCCAGWASPVATAMTVHYQTPEREWSFRLVMFSPSAYHNT